MLWIFICKFPFNGFITAGCEINFRKKSMFKLNIKDVFLSIIKISITWVHFPVVQQKKNLRAKFYAYKKFFLSSFSPKWKRIYFIPNKKKIRIKKKLRNQMFKYAGFFRIYYIWKGIVHTFCKSIFWIYFTEKQKKYIILRSCKYW